MPPTPLPDGPVRPAPRTAALVNEEIRRLVEAGGLGSDAYLRLLVEWAAAVRGAGSQADVRPAA
ncbi:hypothetical protein [Streptomyces sp. NPDC051994]|uniref:hypothetical protein n=1 Tax=unclassified Streptomyces TaxID=2593676 RepID=UPI003415DC1C